MPQASVYDSLGVNPTQLTALPEMPATSQRTPTVFDQALSQYPILKNVGVVPKFSEGQGNDNMLEFWPPGEKGDADSPRPAELPADKPGVEIYSDKTRPIDILGDVVSHHLVKTDPKIAAVYKQFQQSLTPQQQQILQEQYKWAVEKEGEQRPFAEWLQSSGLPAYFRGYAFKQWPDEFNQRAYTPEQRQMFDQMLQYLQTGK